MADPAGTYPSSKDSNGKIISYMWYIHILVKVNTEDRLRDHIAPLLQTDGAPWVPSPGLHRSGSSDEHDSMHGGGGQKMMEPVDDLTDYLVLHFFSDEVLGQLVDTAPLLEQAESYARVLAGVPGSFREEFCRRLYVLLFSRNIVEWPPGIDVPDPAAAAAIAAGASPHHGQRDPEPSDPNPREDEEVAGSEGRGRRCRRRRHQQHHHHPRDDDGSSAAATSPCPDGSDHDSEMAREAYFGTATSPLPWNYFSDWGLSRNGYGALREGAGYDVADSGSSHRQPAPPHTTPQQQQRQQQQQQQQQQEQQQRQRAVSPRCPLPEIPSAQDLSDDMPPASAYQRPSRVNPHHLHRSSGAAAGCEGGVVVGGGGGGGGGAVRIRQVSGQGGNGLSGPGFSPVPGADLASGCAPAVDENHIWGRGDGAEGLLVWWAEEPVASDKGSPNNCWRRAMVRTARKYGTWYPSGHMAPYRTNKQR
ncbi:hypothetical protein VSDG_08211 [Cytospora chrysosperma]|uniref:Uncharacterized protein n=1 Tax=Cytospora chrysosperma TaxID=252740 RepID=A0A423VGA5_CYTCH|nr:hypothetical protein VSDG_08211 [Valsa sordida]